MKKTMTALLTFALILSLSLSAFAATGLGSYTKVTATSAADANGSVSAEISMCAVTLDENGKIVGASFDVVEVKGAFDAAGVVAETAAEPQTKVELGENYGMGQYSPIGKEYNEQMEALAAWCIGKTVEEAITMSADDADLKAGCTIYAGNLLRALEKAAANAK